MAGVTTPASPLLEEKADHYPARAGEYEDSWWRIGRYDRGAEATEWWHAEVKKVAVAPKEAGLSVGALELASGTGWWTDRLAGENRSRRALFHRWQCPAAGARTPTAV